MILKSGDMWRAWRCCDLFCITTNATIKKNGSLVMGAGIARQARDKFLGVDLALGRIISGLDGDYGLLVSPQWPSKKLAAFQTKRHWREPSEVDLIVLSTNHLLGWALRHPDCRIALNFPGIGHGGLSRADVLNIVEILPNNVQVWERT